MARVRPWLQRALSSAGSAATQPGPYWLTRFVLLRLLGLIQCVAFLTFVNQGLPLVGRNGLMPAYLYLERVGRGHDTPWERFVALPTLFWWNASDGFLLGAAYAGLALSLVVLLGFANSLVMAALWILYMSFVHVGQTFYGFGWEIQLLETTFLAIFLCPFLDGRPFSATPPPRPIIWLHRWLIFRIMLGAGLIKIRGDVCWRDLTCLIYHYETQPNPHPLSWLLHQMPAWYHKAGVLANHVVELGAGWFALGPRLPRHVAGVFLVGFQVMLILSGNLAFLNWLTIIPCLACFDDRLLARVLPGFLVRRAERAAAAPRRRRAHLAAAWAVLGLVGWLSVSPLRNMFSPGQIMNTSFDRLHLVNTYGAFGSVGQVRHEVILEGSSDETLDDQTRWREYEFKCKPGDPLRRPCLITPYHYRLDWQIWFAAMSSFQRNPWLVHLVYKLLQNDPGALALLAGNPFPERPPRYVRAMLYEYHFTVFGDATGAWWTRKPVGTWLAPVWLGHEGLERHLAERGWLAPPP